MKGEEGEQKSKKKNLRVILLCVIFLLLLFFSRFRVVVKKPPDVEAFHGSVGWKICELPKKKKKIHFVDKKNKKKPARIFPKLARFKPAGFLILFYFLLDIYVNL